VVTEIVSSISNDDHTAESRTETVRRHLLHVWGKQACQNPDHRPHVLEGLLEKHAALVYVAVAALAREFGDGPPPDDPAQVIRRAFNRLDLEHSRELAALLIEARAGMGAG
jgi:hypothetical protein